MFVRNHHTLSTLSNQQQNISRRKKKTADSAVEEVRSTVNKLSNCKHMEQEQCDVSETELYLCRFKKIFLKGQAAVPGIS